MEISGGSADDHASRAARAPKTKEELLATPLTRRRVQKAKARVVSARHKPPEDLAYLLNWYREIRARNPRGMRAEPVPMSEILAYSTLYRLDIEDWEVDVVCRLDQTWQTCLPEPDK